MNERCHTNSIPWMYATGLIKSGFTELTNCVHSWYGVSVTAVIHGTELMWPRSFMVRSWCDREHSWYRVGVIPQSHSTWFLCTPYSGNSFGGFFHFCSFINDEKIHQISYIRTQPSCAAGFALLNLPKGKSLGRSKPATSSYAQALQHTVWDSYYIQVLLNCLMRNK